MTERKTKPSLGYATCPRHDYRGVLLIKLYIEHWDPLRKRPVLCYVKAEDLPRSVRKYLSTYGHRFKSEGDGQDG